MRILPQGDRAVLVEFADPADRRAFVAALRTQPAHELIEQVEASVTVLLRVGLPDDLPRLVAHVRELRVDPGACSTPSSDGHVLQVPVHYDGPDLAEVSAHLRISVPELVARHTSQLWTVDITGFSPGFGYLVGDSGGLAVPRRRTPRTRVPAGSVALGGDFSGIYPSPSPGGWLLIGHTALRTWQPDRDPPALLTPGRRVQFSEARA